MSFFVKTGSSKKHSSSSSFLSRSHGHKHRSDPRTSAVNLGGSVGSPEDGVRRPTEPSFLFVVNELAVNHEPPAGTFPLTDQWANPMPPTHAGAYGNEHVGTVFRYRSGVITPAAGYEWLRPALSHEGFIVRVDQSRNITGHPVFYAVQSIFTCSPHLPVIVGEGDASLGHSFVRRLCACDRETNINPVDIFPWCILHFSANPEFPGLSMVRTNAVGSPHVVGSNPVWLGTLVPKSYENSRATVASAGLSGNIATLIGLMGLHSRPGTASEVFHRGTWHRHQWSCTTPAYVPGPDEPPRGLLVHVALDNLVNGEADTNENNLSTEACREMMGHLEWYTPLVTG